MDTLWTAIMDAPTAEAAGEALEDLGLWAAAMQARECTCNGLEAQACEVCRERSRFLEDDDIPFMEPLR